jgi:hypothetical protein
MMKVLAVFAEIDLMTVDKFEEIQKVEEYSLFRWLVRCRIKMPLTFSNREAIVVGFGTAIPDTRSVILPFRSLGNNYFGITPPPEDSKYTRFEINYAFYHIKYIDEQFCELTSCFNVDPKIPMIPWFVLNTFLKEIGYYVMRDLKQQVELTVNKDAYEERMQKKAKFYDKIWKTIQEHIDKGDK